MPSFRIQDTKVYGDNMDLKKLPPLPIFLDPNDPDPNKLNANSPTPLVAKKTPFLDSFRSPTPSLHPIIDHSILKKKMITRSTTSVFSLRNEMIYHLLTFCIWFVEWNDFNHHHLIHHKLLISIYMRNRLIPSKFMG